MRRRQTPIFVAAIVLVLACGAWAADQPATEPANDSDEWSFSIAAYTYVVENGKDYVSPVVTADHGWLHLEARYNYEDLHTASAFVGYNFEFGDKLAVALTPMIGAVAGDTDGVAPGYRLSVNWEKLELYSEAEYLFDAHDSSDSFLYLWTELSYHVTDWLRFGVAAQRTRVNRSDLDLEPGVLVGITVNQFDFTVYGFNLTERDPTVVLAVGFSF